MRRRSTIIVSLAFIAAAGAIAYPLLRDQKREADAHSHDYCGQVERARNEIKLAIDNAERKYGLEGEFDRTLEHTPGDDKYLDGNWYDWRLDCNGP